MIGLDRNTHLHLLKTPQPFVANLHGVADDVSSWVLTHSELRRLLRSEGYSALIRSCLTTTTILFLGIRADDIAAGGQLAALTRAGIDTGSHYWLTSRGDHLTDDWAENAGLQVIRYNASNNRSEIDEFFNDILHFVPPENDISPPPVVPDHPVPPTLALPSPASLSQEGAEAIRQALNARVARILEPGTPESYATYEEFASDYDEAIYRAWYTAPGSPLLGFTLEEEAGEGAFGRVYRATASGGNQVAIKVLREEVRRNPQLLGSFRRGVRAMRILSKHHVAGMVTYQQASEIPAFVVMDWVDGPTLTEAVEARYLDDWDSILKVACEMATIIRRAHRIPERVLHRDVRPSNIMFDRFFTHPDAWDVVVLDFDLSWHTGALEQSLVHSTLTGYLAPEQIHAIPHCSTRHAAVDSFGVGMTLFYMISGVDPVPEQHLHNGWSPALYKAAARRASRLVSLSRRYARLIINATNNTQADRWDMTQIQDELQRLSAAQSDPETMVSAELIAEEIAARSERDYEWNDDNGMAHIRLPSGADIRIAGSETSRRIAIGVNWSASGRQERKKIRKWIRPAGERCAKILKAAGWSITTSNVQRTGSIALEATIRASRAATSLSKQVRASTDLVSELGFE